MKAYERLLRYVTFDTASDESNPECPSTASQRVFAKALAAEMRELGFEKVQIDGNGYLYGMISGNTDSDFCIGLIAHLDTVADVPSSPVRPRIITCTGEDIRLENGRAVIGKSCIQCLSCLQFCPTQAIDLGGASVKRQRYHNIRITAEELSRKLIHID